MKQKIFLFTTIIFIFSISLFLIGLLLLIPSNNINIKYLINSSNSNFFDFRNNFIKFLPNSTYFIKSVNFVTPKVNIFDYVFNTNNYGYVQKSDLNPSLRSIIFIGDSFTQGFGSDSWIDNLEIFSLNDKQIINAGIMATGFLDWYHHIEYIKYNFSVEEIYIIFISDDFYRKQFQFNKKSFNCLRFGDNCNSDSSFVFLNISIDSLLYKSTIDSVTNFFKRLIFYIYVRNVRYRENISALNQILNNNIEQKLIFIHIPMINEVKNNEYSFNVDEIKNLINNKNYKYISLLNLCNFNISDYYLYDNHLNSNGYQKLNKCMNNIINSNSLH